MSKNILLLFLSLTLSGFSQSESYNYKFTYKVKGKLEVVNKNSHISENMVLYLGTEKSLYISETKLRIDSARSAIKKRKGSPYEISEFRNQLPKNRITSSIEKNLKTSNITYKNTIIPSKTISFIEPIPEFGWNIKTNKKNILGYSCQKAVLNYKGRSYIAWFSDKLTFQNGPWKFGGLPGLILEISDTQNHYSFKLIGIKKETKLFPAIYQKAIKIKKENFDSTVENIFNSMGNKLIGESKLRFKRERLRRKKMAKPNPIELEE